MNPTQNNLDTPDIVPASTPSTPAEQPIQPVVPVGTDPAAQPDVMSAPADSAPVLPEPAEPSLGGSDPVQPAENSSVESSAVIPEAAPIGETQSTSPPTTAGVPIATLPDSSTEAGASVDQSIPADASQVAPVEAHGKTHGLGTVIGISLGAAVVLVGLVASILVVMGII